MNKLQQASRLRDGCCLQDARLGSRVRALPQPAASRAAAFAASYCGRLQNPGCPAALQFVCWPVLSDGCHSSPPPALPRSSCRRPLPPSSAKATPQLNCPCCPPGRPNRAGAGPFSRPVPSTTCTHSQHAQLHPSHPLPATHTSGSWPRGSRTSRRCSAAQQATHGMGEERPGSSTPALLPRCTRRPTRQHRHASIRSSCRCCRAACAPSGCGRSGGRSGGTACASWCGAGQSCPCPCRTCPW